MASSSLTVYVDNKEIRKYGGTRGGVKTMLCHYKQLSVEQFLNKHPLCSETDYHSLHLALKLNKN